jgi:hypothetical protein
MLLFAACSFLLRMFFVVAVRVCGCVCLFFVFLLCIFFVINQITVTACKRSQHAWWLTVLLYIIAMHS